MAYMSQERKAGIADALKAVIPRNWKYSLAVRHHSTIVLTIAAAPVDLLGIIAKNCNYPVGKYHSLNEYRWETSLKGASTEVVRIFDKIMDAMNNGNHDRSDIQTDYFDVGWYVNVSIGRWGKPFLYTGPKVEKPRLHWNGANWEPLEVAA